jgi:nucleotide-binding universal stress UspA family protein
MYSIVVMVAVTTSFMAPLLLRLTMRLVRVTEEEAERMAEEAARGVFDAQKLRVLVPTAGGPNALVAASIGMCVAKKSAHPITVLYVERVSGLLDSIARRFRPTVAGQNLAAHLDAIRASAKQLGTKEPEVRREESRDVASAINGEAAKGYDLILTGASGEKAGIRGQKLEQLIEGAPCHVAIVKHRGESRVFSRLLVPVDGSFLSRVGIEFAIRYAEGAGPDAEVTFAMVTGKEAPEPIGARSTMDTAPTIPARRRQDSIMLNIGSFAQGEGLDKLSPVFKATKVKTHIVMADGATSGSILEQTATGQYDLLVLGAEHRAIHHRLFFGYENERLVEESAISVVVLVPKVTTGSRA